MGTLRGPNKEATELIRWARDLGWSHSITGNGHLKFEHPLVERCVFTPGTPRVGGNHKEKAKLRTALRRAEAALQVA